MLDAPTKEEIEILSAINIRKMMLFYLYDVPFLPKRKMPVKLELSLDEDQSKAVALYNMNILQSLNLINILRITKQW